MDQQQMDHNYQVNKLSSFQIEKERFEKQQIEFEEMKRQFFANGGQLNSNEESKESISIASQRQANADGFGTMIVPII